MTPMLTETGICSTGTVIGEASHRNLCDTKQMNSRRKQPFSRATRMFAAGALLIGTMGFLGGCASGGAYQVPLMPAPDIYAEQITDPFTDLSPIEIADGDARILYVTNRARDENPDAVEYTNKRDDVIRVGAARVELGEGQYTWEEARRISLLKNRTEDYPIRVAEIDEFGVVPESVHPEDDPVARGADPAATERFIDKVQAQLDRSKVKEINIYVHGYKVVFENPILVAAELWHYLGYEGSFIAFSWPSTPKRLAYFSDSATAEYSAARLRWLLTALAARTTAKRINIIGYSAGTRVVVTALDQLNLLAKYAPEPMRERYIRIGHIILVGADADRDNFARMLGEDVLDIVDDFEIYISGNDKALGLSRWLMAGQSRLGQTFAPEDITAPGKRFVATHPALRFIDVTEAEGSNTGNGHGYFRNSPWVSGDILMALRYGLPPEQRGLVLDENLPVWTFPPDYLQRLRTALEKPGIPAGSAAQVPASGNR